MATATLSAPEIVLSTPPNALKFNLSLAMAGEPVVTRDGRPVTKLTMVGSSGYPIRATVAGKQQCFTLAGTYWIGRPNNYDLFMYMPELDLITQSPPCENLAPRPAAIR
jgi:hypothetical protein